MNLKDAFRYINYLDLLISQATNYVANRKNLTKVTETHLRHEANPDAENQTIEQNERSIPGLDNNRIISLLCNLSRERAAIAYAVDYAKQHYAPISYDASISANKARFVTISALKLMAALKPIETNSTGKGFKFNAEGTQLPYFYDVKTVSSIDFDRNLVKKKIRELTAESDAVSAELDQALISMQVNFSPAYDINETFDDIVQATCLAQES